MSQSAQPRSKLSAREISALIAAGSALGALSGVATFLAADSVDEGLFQVAGSFAIVLVIAGVVVAALRYRRATVAALVVVAALTVGGGLGYVWGHTTSAPKTPPVTASPPPSSSPPSTAPPSSSPPGPVRVRFDTPRPGDPPIPQQSELYLSGTVTGLPRAHKLFIVSRTGDADFFVVKGNTISDPLSYAAASEDGPWEAKDGGVGSETDKKGTRFAFIPIDADPTCAAVLDKAGQTRDDHRIRSDDWPTACHPVQERTSVTIA